MPNISVHTYVKLVFILQFTMVNLLFFSIFLATSIQLIRSEVFTATDDLQQFLSVESELIHILELQIEDYENKLKKLKMYICSEIIISFCYKLTA